MLSKNKMKLIKSLVQKKNRERERLFVAEGPKVVGDLLAAGFQAEVLIDEEEEVRRVSFLQHPQGVLGVFRIPDNEGIDIASLKIQLSHELILALDGIQDPGNLGTIIRIADWFGITTLLCSHQTADAYNPKVVQATMGSLARVRIVYTDLCKMLHQLCTNSPGDRNTIPVYGTLLDGSNIYEQHLTTNGLIVMGNEGNGISPEVRKMVNHKLLIPNFHVQSTSADSLNVAIATAITCSEFRRRELYHSLIRR